MTNPIQTGQLGNDLGGIAPLDPRAADPLVPKAKPIGSKAEPTLAPAWDTAAALDLVEGDQELLEELAQLFAEECPKAMEEIRNALDAKDAVLLERHAHTLKGSSANIGANGVSAAALALEQEARAGNLAKSQEDFRLLQAAIARLIPELQEKPFAKRVP
jgi:two-component system, sensor histidine kinase and response regulator